MRTLYLMIFCLLGQLASAQNLNDFNWHEITATGTATPRHENNFIEFEGKFYLMGGRGIKAVDVFDPKTNTWTNNKKTPIEINHFQAVVYNNLIYVVCAMNGKYPRETPLENVWIYNPKKDSWSKGDAIPKEHQRGGGGAVVYKDKIYVACGVELGHTSGTTNVFSCYDPRTGEWQTLTKAPHIRDHFAAVVSGDKLYCIGGRNSSQHKGAFKNFFNAVVPEVDVYDFATSTWSTLVRDLPVPTAAGGIFCYDNYIVYFGGEASDAMAYSQTQCLDTQTKRWTKLKPMIKGLHGSSAIIYQGKVYWAAGSYKRGGSDTNGVYCFSY